MRTKPGLLSSCPSRTSDARPWTSDQAAAPAAGGVHAEMREGIREPRLQVGVRPRAREHESEALRVLEREGDVSLAELAAGSVLERGVQLIEAFGHQRGEQRFPIGKMPVGSVVGDPSPARGLPHAKPDNSFFFHHLPGGGEHRRAQVPVMICCH